ncbi:ABC transporter permease [Longispora fulva]|uniref:Ribose transport system permease protein n=1 Tax=Longispora fulva TaxID=619741 RepID=A0A8J7GCW2_9ACTN|nr:ABC transporter permease [Longispora fulva]MBG6134107.1 ribose transport system permease protein [Longispora fulva]GIG62480.1 ABC transporter permease [Longispora fulva]
MRALRDLARPTAARPAPAPRRGRYLPLLMNQRVGLTLVIIALVVVFSSLRPAFLDTRLTIAPLLADITVYIVVGLAQLAVLSLGHMNVAVGRMAALSTFAMGFAYSQWDVPLIVGLLIGLAVGAAIGALSGGIIAVTGVNSFVVTLALDFGLLGLVTILYTRFAGGVAFSARPAGLSALRNDTFANYCLGDVCGPRIPLVLPIAVIAAIAVGVLFRHARVGREMLMSGSNMRAAELSGIPTRRRVVQAHALSGLLAALAGFLLAANNGAFSAAIGEQFLLPSFLAPVLGGTLLAGGAVSVLGTVLGATASQVIYKGLNLLQFSLENLKIYIGLVLLVALSLDRVRTVLVQRRQDREAAK